MGCLYSLLRSDIQELEVTRDSLNRGVERSGRATRYITVT